MNSPVTQNELSKISEEQADRLITEALERKDLSQIRVLAGTNKLIHKVFAAKIEQMVGHSDANKEATAANHVATASTRISSTHISSTNNPIQAVYVSSQAHSLQNAQRTQALNKTQHIRQ